MALPTDSWFRGGLPGRGGEGKNSKGRNGTDKGKVKEGELSHFSKRSDASEKSFVSLNIKMLKLAKTVYTHLLTKYYFNHNEYFTQYVLFCMNLKHWHTCNTIEYIARIT